MAKKKKKGKEKSKTKEKSKAKEKSKVESSTPDLNDALKSAKKTQSTLHGLLKVVTEEKSYIAPIEKEEKIAPHLSYEKKKKLLTITHWNKFPFQKEHPLRKKHQFQIFLKR